MDWNSWWYNFRLRMNALMHSELAFVSPASLLTSFFLTEAFRGVCGLTFCFLFVRVVVVL
jgi:hypothetical protein